VARRSGVQPFAPLTHPPRSDELAPPVPDHENTPADGLHARVLDRDPELAHGLAADDFALASRHLVARTSPLEPGEWTAPWGADDDPDGSIGALVLDGLLLRVQRIGNVASAELLGSGDVLRPWLTGHEGSSLPASARWQVLQPTTVAILDRRFTVAAGRWPEVVTALIERSVQRARLLAFQMAIANVRRIDARLLLLLWRLADRWGRVTSEGVVVPLRLTHGWLANLVGAQRPSVTTALGNLAGAGRVERLEDGSWLLRGHPPDIDEPLFAAGHASQPV
jgi:CRP/FNR family cyclic AMP-dependent transcriptional regulator